MVAELQELNEKLWFLTIFHLPPLNKFGQDPKRQRVNVFDYVG